MALDGTYEDDAFWDLGDGRTTGNDTSWNGAAAGGYAGPVPTGYTQADVEDFLRRNPGDEHRVMEALTPPPQQSQTFTFANPGGSNAPAPPSPFGSFGFDASQAGKSAGFQFKFDKAIEAIGRLGAAKGTYFNPQTWKAAEAEATGLANQDLNDEFSRQAGVYDRNFGTHQWNEGSRYDAQRANRNDDYSMMSADRAFNRGTYESDRNYDYTKSRDNMSDMWRFVDYGYNSPSYAR